MFREVLRNYKKERGLTGCQLATELDVHYSTISLWLAGKREPTLRHLRKIRRLTNVPYEQLLSEPRTLGTTLLEAEETGREQLLAVQCLSTGTQEIP